MDSKLVEIISKRDEEISKAFSKVEEGILKYGLDELTSTHVDEYFECISILSKRLKYDSFTLRQYFKNLDDAFQSRSKFLAHIHNQNTIKVLEKYNLELEDEMKKVKEMIENLPL